MSDTKILEKCEIKVVEGPLGKKHFECECPNAESRNALAEIFAEEAILRIKPAIPVKEA